MSTCVPVADIALGVLGGSLWALRTTTPTLLRGGVAALFSKFLRGGDLLALVLRIGQLRIT